MTRCGAVWAALFTILALAARLDARGMHQPPGTETATSNHAAHVQIGSTATQSPNAGPAKPSAAAANTAASTGPTVVVNATTASITVTARNVSQQGPIIPMPAAHPHKPFNTSSKCNVYSMQQPKQAAIIPYKSMRLHLQVDKTARISDSCSPTAYFAHWFLSYASLYINMLLWTLAHA
jgi:hypothetical protein